jgi:formylglycine-generating enzyme required for sulfatase activity
MASKVRCVFVSLVLVLGSALCASAQLRPEVTVKPKPKKPPTAKVTPKPAEKLPPEPALAPGTARENPKDGLKYVWIPPGTFMMGCSPGDGECDDDETPAHRVTITKGFWLGQTELTVGTYKRFATATGRGMPEAPSFNPGWSNERMPIVNVSWLDAEAYCRWAGGRLPSEAEWEYAARAGSTEARYGLLDEVAWYDGNSGGRTHEVGQKRPNAFNLYDMLGNVWEWVSDWYGENYYQGSPERDPLGPGGGETCVLRGGSWSRNPWYSRVSNRVRGRSDGQLINLGFRCVREVVP